MKITTKEATIKTATVEVKSLTISGRQVTLSVFRQLLNEDLLDPMSAELNGVPWGRVNYFFAGCVNDHLHIVWQKGDELRRTCAYKTADLLPMKNFLSTARKNAVDFLEAYRIHCFQKRKDRERFDAPDHLVIKIGPITASVGTFPSIAKKRIDHCFRNRHFQTALRESEEDLQTEFLALTGGKSLSIEEIDRQLHWIQAQAEKLHERWLEHYRALDALDQLFIAV